MISTRRKRIKQILKVRKTQWPSFDTALFRKAIKEHPYIDETRAPKELEELTQTLLYFSATAWHYDFMRIDSERIHICLNNHD